MLSAAANQNRDASRRLKFFVRRANKDQGLET
jgi:hypothetical protein